MSPRAAGLSGMSRAAGRPLVVHFEWKQATENTEPNPCAVPLTRGPSHATTAFRAVVSGTARVIGGKRTHDRPLEVVAPKRVRYHGLFRRSQKSTLVDVTHS